MQRSQLHHRSRRLPAATSGTLLEVTPATAGWEFISFAVKRLAAGERTQVLDASREVCVVLLSGHCRVRLGGAGWQALGPRRSVFESYPHALYLPAGTACEVEALAASEIADARAPATAALAPRLVRPEDCGYEIRGGGNATRQIIDILPPPFPAERLLVCEVFTPGGNWSSYPPHKHDVDNPPVEVDLEETYYFRIRGDSGYAFQRLYTADERFDETFRVEDGDLLLIPEGYHPFVTAFGYDAYYLNVLAGTRRSMAASDDPRYARMRQSWPPPDPRLPLVPRPERQPA